MQKEILNYYIEQQIQLGDLYFQLLFFVFLEDFLPLVEEFVFFLININLYFYNFISVVNSIPSKTDTSSSSNDLDIPSFLRKNKNKNM